MRRRLIALGLAAAAVAGAVALAATRGDGDPGGGASAGSPFETRTEDAGEVTVEATLVQLGDAGAVAEVVFDTHAVKLDLDVAAGATLTVGGVAWPTGGWEGDGPGGHHREGELLELFGVAYGMGEEAVAAGADGLYATLGFEHWRAARVEELSGGTRAKLNLALALLADPEVLLLDEPYAGFDWDTYQRFWDLAAERRAAGRSVLVISHFVTDQERFDRLVELRDGKTVSR